MNTEQKHTPGPWRVGDGSFVIGNHPAPGITGSDDVHHYGGHLICESVSQANARLIAAAPELLEAAKQALQVFVDQGWDDDLSAAKSLKAAIAKAEGGAE